MENICWQSMIIILSFAYSESYLHKKIARLSFRDKGTFNSESAVDMSNRHIKVPKIAPALLFPINGMNCSEKILIF